MTQKLYHERNGRLRVLDSVYIANVLDEMGYFINLWSLLFESPRDAFIAGLNLTDNQLSNLEDTFEQYIAADSQFCSNPEEHTTISAVTSFLNLVSFLFSNKIEPSKYYETDITHAANTLKILILKTLVQTAEGTAHDETLHEGIALQQTQLRESIQSLGVELCNVEDSVRNIEAEYSERKAKLEASLEASRKYLSSLHETLDSSRCSHSLSSSLSIRWPEDTIMQQQQSNPIYGTEEIKEYARLISEEARVRSIHSDMTERMRILRLELNEENMKTRLIKDIVVSVESNVPEIIIPPALDQTRAAVSIQSLIRSLFVQREFKMGLKSAIPESKPSQRMKKGGNKKVNLPDRKK